MEPVCLKLRYVCLEAVSYTHLTALGKKEINGVFIAEDGYLIEEYREPANTERIAGTLRKFAGELGEGQPEPKLMLVPTAFYVYREKLPEHAPWSCLLYTSQLLLHLQGSP